MTKQSVKALLSTPRKELKQGLDRTNGKLYTFNKCIQHLNKNSWVRCVVRWCRDGAKNSTLEQRTHLPEHFFTNYWNKKNKSSFLSFKLSWNHNRNKNGTSSNSARSKSASDGIATSDLDAVFDTKLSDTRFWDLFLKPRCRALTCCKNQRFSTSNYKLPLALPKRSLRISQITYHLERAIER